MTKSSKEIINQSGESRKKAGIGVKNTIVSCAGTIGNILKGTYQAIDAGDKKIGESIEKKRALKGKNTKGKIGKMVRNNIAKALIGVSVLTYGGTKISQNIKEKKIDNKEQSINNNEKKSQGAIIEDLQYIEQGVKLLRDGSLTFYVVQNGEGLHTIKEKLQKIQEFSYLADTQYKIPNTGRNIKSFNTPNSSLTPGFFLPIPIKAENREIEISDFKKHAKQAIEQLKNDKFYGEKIKKLLQESNENEIISIMTAFARSESSQDRSQFQDPIGSVELHRREPKYKAYSFSYYHILMGQGPGITARKNLGLTEGDCYDPVNACKLFIGYCFEKIPNNTSYFFNIKNLDDAKKVGKTYNGSYEYGNKLRANINHCKNN